MARDSSGEVRAARTPSHTALTQPLIIMIHSGVHSIVGSSGVQSELVSESELQVALDAKLNGNQISERSAALQPGKARGKLGLLYVQ